MLVEEITHRVVNEYAVAIAQLSVAAARTDDPAGQAVLREAAARLQRCADAHRVLRRPPSDDMMDLGVYLEQLGRAMCDASLCDRGIRLELTMGNCRLSADRCWRVGLICAELITNAMRHGLSTKPGAISVLMFCGEGLVHCWIVDEGGPSAPPQAPSGLGCQIVQCLAEDLGGRVEWRFASQGAAAMLSFPLLAPDPDQ